MHGDDRDSYKLAPRNNYQWKAEGIKSASAKVILVSFPSCVVG